LHDIDFQNSEKATETGNSNGNRFNLIMISVQQTVV